MANTVNTDTLMTCLFRTSSFETYRLKNSESMKMPAFCEYITELCAKKGEVRERVIKRAQIDRVYGHQIFTGRYMPSRDKVIQLAFGLELSVEGAQQLLRVARKSALYPRIARDAAIIYCLSHGVELLGLQELLSDNGLAILGGDKDTV